MEFKTDVAMCLCCSRSYVLTRQAIYAAKKRGHNYTGYFCSRACAGKWKQFEAGRKHKCAKCNRRTGWARRGDIVCLTCQHANRIGSGTCPRCNQTFEKHQREQTFCSMACYRKYKVEMRQIPCTKCGKQFSPISNRRIKFCSRDCANKGPLGENRGKKKRAIIEQLRVLRLMNRQRMKDEKAWRKEQKKICRCGQPIFEGRNCSTCTKQRKIMCKRVQHRKYKAMYDSGHRQAVINRDGAVCQYCGVKPDVCSVDHMIPLLRGGSDEMENLVVACRKCNSIKHTKTPLELFNWPKWIAYKNSIVSVN